MKKRYGLMAHVTTGTLKHPTREELEREFSRPWSMPNTNLIYFHGSWESYKKLKEAIEDYNKTNGTGTT